MKQLLAILCLFGAMPVLATDYHVVRDTDQDGKANCDAIPAAHQGTCSGDSVSCSGASIDMDSDGSTDRLYCNLQSALDQATSPGDTVSIHQGTWTVADSTQTYVRRFCDTTDNVHHFVWAAVKPCASCTSEGARRVVKAADYNGTTASVTLAGSAATTGTFAVCTDGNENCDFVTLKNFDITDGVHNFASCNVSYVAPIEIGGGADWLQIDNVNVDTSPTYDTAEECDFGGAGEKSPACLHSVGFNGGSDATMDYLEIKNSTWDCCSYIGIKSNPDLGACDGLGGSTYDRISMHDNTLISRGKLQIEWEIKGSCDMVFYNNIVQAPNAGSATSGKWRKMQGDYYVFNNYFDYPRMFQCQDEASGTSIYVFNNTANDLQESGNGCGSAKVWFLNNSHETTGGDVVRAADRAGWEHFTGTNSYSPETVGSDMGNHICNDNSPCGAASSVTACGGSGGCNAGNPGRALSGPPPFPLSPGSILIDAGTNDPLGQGPGNCIITGFPEGPIDCSISYNGLDRDAQGASWDIGADEFDFGGGGSSAECGNGERETGELCDGQDLGGNSCTTIPGGFTGGQLACAGNCGSFVTSSCTTGGGGDVDSPGQITDLSATAPQVAPQLHVQLQWTARGDDGSGGGPATVYDVRYRTDGPVNAANWNSATPVEGEPTPGNPGASESFLVVGLAPGTTYHWAVRARDEAGNESSLSDSVSRTTEKYQGYGHATRGGGGHPIIHVTNLNNSGPGSFREAVTGGGNRYVVFDVGGVITMNSTITIGGSNVTIDGSTAPSPGITIQSVTDLNDGLEIRDINEVILTYLRFEGIYDPATGSGSNSDDLIVVDNSSSSVVVTNMVWDHLTVRNVGDGAIEPWDRVQDMTISHCLMLNNYHPQTFGGNAPKARVSIHHNLWANSGERQPQLRGSFTDLVLKNNIHYDWGTIGSYAIRIRNNTPGCTAPCSGDVDANIVNNVFLDAGGGNAATALVFGSVAGPDPGEEDGPSTCLSQGDVYTAGAMGQLHVAGNVFPAATCDVYSTVASERSVPADATVPTDPIAALGTTVLSNVGALFTRTDEQQVMGQVLAALGTLGGGGDPIPAVQNLRRTDVAQ